LRRRENGSQAQGCDDHCAFHNLYSNLFCSGGVLWPGPLEILFQLMTSRYVLFIKLSRGVPVVTGTGFDNAIRRAPSSCAFCSAFHAYPSGKNYRADGNGADCLAALRLIAVDRVSGESAKRQNGQDA
jgi:hypothetical protein